MRSKPTAYIETTIPSFHFEVRDDPASRHWCDVTRRWWSQRSAEFTLVTSGFTLLELESAPDFIRAGALELMSEVLVLEAPERLGEVVKAYIDHKVMPRDDQGDAAHLAMAALYGCDYLLTWNCRHLANGRKVRHIEAVNRMLGLPSPIIVTPEGLLEETD